jgi:polyisoprenoid-binding protein YceI
MKISTPNYLDPPLSSCKSFFIIHTSIVKKTAILREGSMMLRHLLLASTTVLSLASSFAFGANYVLDTAHSTVEFKVKHLMISNVSGFFKEFKGTGSGTFTKDQAIIDSIDLEINPASIDTHETKRDEHLRAAEIFNVEKFKSMTFKSTKVDYVNKFPSKIYGNFTMHGVTKPITLDVTWGGVAVDPWKNEKLAFDAETVLSRKEFGMTWNKTLETGGVVVSDDVRIKVSVEATRVTEESKMSSLDKTKEKKK